MRRREFISLLGSTAVWPLAARAQQGAKKYAVIGFLSASSPDPLNNVTTEALRELGWVEGENVVVMSAFDPKRKSNTAIW